jgi:stage II sporulation protein R
MNNNNNENIPDLVSIDQILHTSHTHGIRNTFLSRLHRKPLPRGFNFRLLMLILFFAAISTLYINTSAKADISVQEGIAQKVLRFHVIANSDSEEDQQLKLIVKESLVNSLSPQLKDMDDITKVKAIIAEQLDTIKATAENIIQQQGYDYAVAVSLEKCYFPLKVYDNYAFPPGYYEALRVKIGKAEGKNWWCVMFPPLCFVDETYSIVDENSKEKLLELLSEEEYDALISGKTPVKIKFKLVEKIKDLFED